MDVPRPGEGRIARAIRRGFTPVRAVAILTFVLWLNYVDRGIVAGAGTSIKGCVDSPADCGALHEPQPCGDEGPALGNHSLQCDQCRVCGDWCKGELVEQTGFGVDNTRLGLLQSAFMVGYVVGAVVFAQLVGKTRPFKLIAAGLTVWILSCLGSAMAGWLCSPNHHGICWSYKLMVAMRAMSGVGEASINTLTLPFLDSVLDPDTKGFYIGIYYTAIPVGTACGFMWAGTISALTDGAWQWAFALEAPIMVPFALLAFFTPFDFGEAEDLHARNMAAGDYARLADSDDDDGGGALAAVEARGHAACGGASASASGEAATAGSASTLEDDSSSGSAGGGSIHNLGDRGHVPREQLELPPPIAISTTSTTTTTNNNNINGSPGAGEEHARSRGASISSAMAEAGLRANVWECVRRPAFVLGCLGYAVYTGVVAGLGFYGPLFIQDYRPCDPRWDLDQTVADLVFGLVIVCSGLLGTVLGGLLVDRAPRTAAGRKARNALVRQLLAQVLLGLALSLAALKLEDPLWFFVLLFFGITALFMVSAGINLVILGLVPPAQRPMATALTTLAIHVFGDVPSPLVIGAISDAFSPLFTLSATALALAATALLWAALLATPVEHFP